jgi:opacity protein-like surface antigen
MAPFRSLAYLLLLAATAEWAPVNAQTPPASAASGLNSRAYLGLSLGRAKNSPSCTSTSLVCDENDTAIRLYGGALPQNHWGVELGYLDMGRIAREGGKTGAQGLNLSLVGKAPVPLVSSLGVFGRLGTTYGRPEASASNAAIAAGTERGFGLSYSAGLSYDFTKRLSATLEWDSNDFRFAGSGRDPVRSTSLGLQYRY